MNATLKKTLLAAIPLAGLLLTAPTAFAYSRHPHHYQRDSGAHCRPSYNRGWRDDRRSYRNDDYDRRGWDNNRRWNDDYHRSRQQRPFYSDSWWWYNSNYR
jgi:hypothetical protein